MNPLFHTGFSISDSLKSVRKSVLIYETIIEGLRQDIFNNTSRCFEGEPAYDLYVNWMCGGVEPQQEDSLTDRMHRLANGTDETSITYL